MSRFLLTALLAVVAFPALSQPEAYYLRKASGLEMEVQPTGLKIIERYSADKVFQANFDKYAKESVFYSDFDPLIDLQAQTLAPNNARRYKVTTIETKDIVQPGIFYGGYKRKDFVFPSLVPGSIGHLEYTKSISEMHIVTPFYFDDDVEVKEAEFSVTFPLTVAIRFYTAGDRKDQIKFTDQVIGDKRKYSWNLRDIPAYQSDENSPGHSFHATHVIVFIDSYQQQGKKINVLSNVSDLYAWYGSLVKQIPAGGDDKTMRETVDRLTRGLPTDEEKIRAVFQWVQKNIKYIAFEEGMAGFVPRAANDVFTKRYGDCKDMANLLKEMLGLAHVNAYLTWIGTRSKPYRYDDVPSPVSDNHMICSVKLKDDFVFLDATNPFVAFGKPSSMIQGKEALIGIGDSEFKVITVPVVDRHENNRVDSTFLHLTADGVRGIFHSKLTGYKKDDIEIAQLRAQVQDNRNYVRDFFTVGNNNIAMDSVGMKGLGDQNAAGLVLFRFFQPGYYKTIGDKIYMNMNFNKTLPGEKIDLARRTQWLESKYRFEDRSVTVFTIPPGYTVSSLPANTEKVWPDFGVTSKYIVKSNTITLEKTFSSNYLYLDKSQFATWNDMIQSLTAINLQSVTLSKSK
jgi:hypothetical protein